MGGLWAEKANSQNIKSHIPEEEVAEFPFEEGHEAMSSGEIFRTGVGEKDQPGWATRVVPNKYPILPAHEVIVHSVDHVKDIESFTIEQVANLIWTYLSRYRHYEKFGYVHIFCNRGREAAASLKNPHSQLIVLDEMARATLTALEVASALYRN